MNFTEVVNEVLAIVKRPDKITDARREVNAAISFCCIDSDFVRDFSENSFAIDSSLYSQSLALSSFTRFRKFAYIKPPATKYYIKPIAPDKVFHGECEEVNRYYIAGDNVVFKLSALTSALLIGWYSYPPTLTDASPTHWLLDAAPWMIIDRAAAKVFANIGDDKSSSKHDSNFAVSYQSARRDLQAGFSA